MRDLPNQTMGSTGTEATVRPEEWLLARAIAAMVGHHSLGLVPARPLESRHWEGALRLAAFHRLVPVLYYASQSGDSLPQVPAGVLPVLKREHHATLARNLLLRAHLQQLLQAFQERDIPVIVLKGVVLDELYPQPGLRSFGDIDLLMRPADLPQGEELLRSLGFSPAGQPRAHARGFLLALARRSLFPPATQHAATVGHTWPTQRHTRVVARHRRRPSPAPIFWPAGRKR